MRGYTDPAPDRAPGLSARGRQLLLAAALVLLVASLLTGRAGSPLLIPLAAVLCVIVRYATSPIELLVPLVAALIVSVTETLAGGSLARGLGGGLLLLAALVPGAMWRVEAKRAAARLTQLDEILTQARRGRTGSAELAAAELEDLELALEALAERIGARSVVLWDVTPYSAAGRARASSNKRRGFTVRLPGHPMGWVWEQGMRLRLTDTPSWAEQGTIVIADRLRPGDETGLMITYAFDPDALPVDDPPFTQAAVYLRGLLALYDARAGWAETHRRVESLLRGLDALPADADLPVVAASLCSTAMEMTSATGAALARWDGESGVVVAVAGGDDGPTVGESVASESELALAVRHDALIVKDAASWSLRRSVVAHPGEKWIHHPRCIAALPLHNTAGSVNGVITVWSANASELNPQAVELLRLLEAQAALYIEQERRADSLQATADRDPLTQLRNRRAFDKVFAEESVRFTRHGRPLALLVIDLDHFKSINDQFGHEAGDEVLTRTARIIERSIRDMDTPARFGGEEFVILLPETTINAALEVAERIRAAVADTDIEFKGRRIPVRTSIGVSSCPDRVALPSDLVASADAALYKAKAAGRNRVVAAA